uniref:Uncharacterized protein n=1 Tax=Glossina palpalis gambiensis TaxID=67801 RepID=A0A1B0AZF1_9MUSC
MHMSDSEKYICEEDEAEEKLTEIKTNNVSLQHELLKNHKPVCGCLSVRISFPNFVEYNFPSVRCNPYISDCQLKITPPRRRIKTVMSLTGRKLNHGTCVFSSVVKVKYCREDVIDFLEHGH